jgi:hypothetical protein
MSLFQRLGLRLPVLGPVMTRSLVLESGLFDRAYYLERYADIAASGADPLDHYLSVGAAELRDPTPCFRTAFYLAHSPDVAAGGINPLVHYLLWGAREGRDPSPFFDTSFYLDANPDVRASGANALAHFLVRGRREGRQPCRRSGPPVDLYTTCWNDVRQLGFFFRHYDPLVSRYVVFDDGSTDGSLDVLRGHPKVEVRRLPRTHPDSFVLSELDLFNHCWKESRGHRGSPAADWVIVCSVDEHLVHPDLAGYLSRCSSQGITVIPALGFQMFTDAFPGPDERLSETRTAGVPDEYDCKLAVFSPTAIDEIGYEPGEHVARPVGPVLAPGRTELMLQHYQLLGIDDTLRRFAELASALGAADRANNWGHHYSQTREELVRRWADYRLRVVDTAAVRGEPEKVAKPPEWWKALPRAS